MSNKHGDTTPGRVKERFMPLVITDRCDHPFIRYFVVEFTEEAKLCVNLYAVTKEVKKVTVSSLDRFFFL